MKIMSVDYGDKRTGIAFCDVNEILASPYTVIKESYQPKLIEQIKNIIEMIFKSRLDLTFAMIFTFLFKCRK